MEEVFADTGYWLAMHSPNDQWHEEALVVTEQLGDCLIVTTELVIVEFLNGVSRFGRESRIRAVHTARALYTAPSVEVVTQVTQESLSLPLAIERYANRLDQWWSVTDCASFLIMEERGIRDALAYDIDFVQAGFRALLREG